MTLLIGRATGGTTTDFTSANEVGAVDFVAAASGDLAVMFFHTKVANAALTELELGIYADSAGAPGTLLARASAVGTSGGAITGTGIMMAIFASPVAILSGTTYHLAWLGVGESFDWQGENTGSYRYASGAYTDIPSTFVMTSTTVNHEPIIWGATADDIPAISVVGAGAVAFGAAAGTTVAPAIPTHVAGDLLVAVRAMKHSTTESLTAEAGWARGVAEQAGGAGSFAADTGPTKICIDYLEATGAGTTVTFDNTAVANTVAWAQVIVLRKSVSGAVWNVAGVSGTDDIVGAAYSVAFGSDPGFIAKDIAVIGVSTPTDVTAAHWTTPVSLTATGLTAAVTERGDAVSGNGFDIGAGTWTAEVSAGPSSSNPTFAATATGTTTNIAGPCAMLRVRADATPSLVTSPPRR